MNLELLGGPDAVAEKAASLIAEEIWEAVASRGRFMMAVSGGRTPWLMLRRMADANIPWRAVQIFQVDERVAPAGDADRNLTHISQSLLERAPLSRDQIFAMPVESPDLEAAAAQYSRTLEEIAGPSPVLDLVHLGLGLDGHTASLVPGDPVLAVDHPGAAMTGVYQGRRRMTLTYPTLNRARRVLWVVTGSEKAEMLPRLLAGDRQIPAGRVRRDAALVLADSDAARVYRSTRRGGVLCA